MNGEPVVVGRLRTRESFRVLEQEHFTVLNDAFNKSQTEGVQATKLSTLTLCLEALQTSLPWQDFQSFFTIGGYHGMPFRGAGWGNQQWWGGYCHHGNILFPVWHRAYLFRLEKALINVGIAKGITGAENLALPFWDEAEELLDINVLHYGGKPQPLGVPDTFGMRQVPIVKDGRIETIRNPLFSYKFQRGVTDNLAQLNGGGDIQASYTKAAGYETVRFPLSGLVGDPPSQATTKAHNDNFPDDDTNFEILNNNVRAWLNKCIYIPDDPIQGNKPEWTGVREEYKRCLNAPYYTVFSNTTSATEWNEVHFGVSGWTPDPKKPTEAYTPIESPHNSIHLAVGGFDLASINAHLSPVAGANGDMGENDTAAFDPIFFFHHCHIDRMFWLWQIAHDQTEKLNFETELFDGYPGTNSVDNQGPTPGVAGGTWLSLDKTPLDPFFNPIDVDPKTVQDPAKKPKPIYGQDVANIEGDFLGYTYGPGSFSDIVKKGKILPVPGVEHQPNSLVVKKPIPVVRVSGLSRDATPGSMLVTVFADVKGVKRPIGHEAVLSRWHVSGCANCQTHLGVKTFVPLHGFDTDTAKDLADNGQLSVHVHSRDNMTGHEGVQAKRLKWDLGTVGHH